MHLYRKSFGKSSYLDLDKYQLNQTVVKQKKNKNWIKGIKTFFFLEIVH